MGVSIYILDRRATRLSVGGVEHRVGSLRRFWKITEVDGERSYELKEAEAAVSKIASPPVAMVADVSELPLGQQGGTVVRAHLVIGWDEGRSSVTDIGWDYLPTVGYGVRNKESDAFDLHEERTGVLYPVDRKRAEELGFLDSNGKLIQRGQPTIVECRSVRQYIIGYAEADCTFENGKIEKLLIGITGEDFPTPSWLIGKKPMQVVRFPSA